MAVAETIAGRRWLQIRRILGAFSIATLTNSAVGQEAVDYSGGYLCLQEFGGGIRFDEPTGRWESTTFRPSGRFVLTLKKLRDQKVYEWSEMLAGVYEVRVADFGDSDPPICYGYSGSEEVVISDTIMVCTYFTEYRVNMDGLRFLEIYKAGFIDGADNGNNTPSMMGGTCARIN
jgi:hypothetical protein